MNRAERIRDAAAVLARDPQEAYHAGAMEQLAKVGVPQLLAVFEAAREMLAAERANTAALAEYRSCVLTQEDLSDGYRERVNSRERFHAAKLALAAALAPLLAEAK